MLNSNQHAENRRDDEAHSHQDDKKDKDSARQPGPVLKLMGRMDGGQSRQEVRLDAKGLPYPRHGEEQEERGKNAAEIKMNGAQFFHNSLNSLLWIL